MNGILEKIKSGKADVVADLKKLEDPCSLTSGGETLFNLAIKYNHTQAIDFFLANKKCINLVAPIDEKVKKKAKMISGEGVDIESTEKSLINIYGEHTGFLRTPLLQACRYGNIEIIDKLLSAGANPKVKDALGYTPAELCLFSTNTETLSKFIDSCIQHKCQPTISSYVLTEVANKPQLFEHIVSNCDLDIESRRFVFALACAYLDVEKVRKLVDDGYQIANMVAEFYNPVFEACTSALLHRLKLPGYQRLAPLYCRHEIYNGNSDAVEFETIIKARTIEEFDSLAQRGIKKPAISESQHREFPWIPETLFKEQMAQRLKLVEFLLQSGINVKKTTQYCATGLVEEVAQLGNLDLLILLEKHGIDMSLEDEDDLAFIANNLCESSRARIVPYLIKFIDE